MFRPKRFQPAVVDRLLKSLLSKPTSSQESKRRKRNTDFIDGDTEGSEAEDDPAAEMVTDAKKAETSSSENENVEDPGTSSSSSVVSFDENFSMPTLE